MCYQLRKEGYYTVQGIYSHPLLLQAARFSRLINRSSFFSRKPLPCRKMSFADIALLVSLERAGEETGVPQMRMSDISDDLGISKPAATQLVAKMFRQGMLERVHCPNDKRSVLVRMTPKAASQLHELLDRLNTIFLDVVDDMGEEDAKEFDRLLSRFYDLLTTRIQKEEI